MAKIEEIVKELDYKTFIKIIDNIPSCIFFKDTELRYRFSTHFWEQLQSEDIIGKTDLEIRKDTENAILAMEADREIIRNGKGCKYVIRSEIDGNLSYLELIKEPVTDEDGKVIGIVGLINDVTEKTLLEQKLKELSTTDMLTGLLNRHTGTEKISKVLENGPFGSAFCLLDLNSFKSINDQYGHQMGDQILREFGRVLKESTTERDIPMRLGGDEFIVLLDGVSETEQILSFIRTLRENIEAISIEGLPNFIHFSVGVKIISMSCSFDSAYSEADKNMYFAKKQDGHLFIS